MVEVARKLRLEFAGACYHVINRGNYRRDLFAAAGAAQSFFRCLDQASTRFGWRVHAFVIMRNHFHLALETPEPNLSDGMKWLQGTWAQRFNRFRAESGRPFQGRFKAGHVEPGHVARADGALYSSQPGAREGGLAGARVRLSLEQSGAFLVNDQQARFALVPALEKLLRQCHPLAAELCRPLGLSYYWSVDQSEYATDIMFKSPAALAAIYPQLVHHRVQHCGSADVLRFLGRVVPAHGHVHRLYKGEVKTNLTHGPEGVRLKHSASGNSIKIYDEHGQILRVETTMSHPEAFRVYRRPEWQALALDCDTRERAVRGQLEAAAPQNLPRGIGALTWVILAREICDWTRFKNRRQVASYTGLCPGIHTSDGKGREGSINRCGNRAVRTALVELVWRLARWQPGYKPVRLLVDQAALSPRRRRKHAVAAARRLAIDLWRLATGQTTPEKLGLNAPFAP